MLWLYQRVFFGETRPELAAHMPDLGRREWAAVLPLVVLMVWMGTLTQSFLPPITKSAAAILDTTKVGVSFEVRAVRPGGGLQPARDFSPAHPSDRFGGNCGAQAPRGLKARPPKRSTHAWEVARAR
jgi:hypothetical protein